MAICASGDTLDLQGIGVLVEVSTRTIEVVRKRHQRSVFKGGEEFGRVLSKNYVWGLGNVLNL